MYRTASVHSKLLPFCLLPSFSSKTNLSSSSSLSTLLTTTHRLNLLATLFRPLSETHRLNDVVLFRNYSGGSHGVVSVRCFSSTPQTLEWNEPIDDSESFDDHVEVEGNDKSSIPVKAYLFSTSVDLKSLVDQNKSNFVPPTSRMTNYVVFKFGIPNPGTNGLHASISQSDCCYMVVFQYGSIVLFNVPEHAVDGYLKLVKEHASGTLPETRKDEYEVREKPSLKTWMRGGLDYIMLQYLNIDGIRTIGSVLGQSIALDYYGRQVDGMVAEFTDINRGMEKTGTFTMKPKKLFQLVGKANSNLGDVILKLGLFERSDIAWKDAKYAQIWEYLRDEFELTQRFANLDFKLKFVEHNIRFLQEILQNRRSDFLEWVIIILITTEILISVYDIVHRANDRCMKEMRKAITGEHVLWAISTLGFEDYVEPLKLYLRKYRKGGARAFAKEGGVAATQVPPTT